MKKNVLTFCLLFAYTFCIAQTTLSEMKEKYLGQEYFKKHLHIHYNFSTTSHKTFFLKEAKSFKITNIGEGSRYNVYWFELLFDSGEFEKIESFEFEQLIKDSETKRDREKHIEKELKIKGKSYFVCWQKREPYQNVKFYTNCDGGSFVEEKIIEKRTNAEFALMNGAKYLVKDVKTNDFGFSYDYELQNEQGDLFNFDQLNFWKFEKIAESDEQRSKRFSEEKQKDATDKEKRIKLQSKYGTKTGKLISEHRVQIGMTKEMCRSSWGEPSKVNTTTTKYGTHEQWVYSDGSYLYFEKGVLTTIQD